MIKLEQVHTEGQRKIVRYLIENYHSYVPSSKSVGRRIDWLIYDDDTFPLHAVGMIGIGSSVYPPPKDMLEFIGLSKSEYKDVFNSVANNWRFCMKKSIKNGGTQVLKQVRQLAPNAWKEKYGDDLNYLITFVGGGNTGAVYKADNWSMVGETAGLPKHKMVSMKWNTGEELKEKFVKPTGEDKKLIFMKKL
tara:strand:- start:215 stop:790 length:576 start_codon:yes stop_codon:yes gene_type:complete